MNATSGSDGMERLSRIEDKLDKLSEAVVRLARMEERMITLFNRMDKYDSALEKIVGRLDILEKNMAKGSVIGRLFDRAFWIVLGAGVAFIFKQVGQ